MYLPLVLSLVLNLSLSLALWALVRFMKSQSREASREKMVLLNSNRDFADRIMHTEGKTWTPPPRPEVVTEEVEFEPDWEEV